MTDWTKREKTRIQIAIGVTTASVITVAFCCVYALINFPDLEPKPAVTPEEFRYGLAEDHAALAAPIVAASPPFQIVDAAGRAVVQDNRTANIRPWELIRELDCPGKPVGQDWPNIPQEIGDCVSWGYCNAANITIGVGVRKAGQLRGPPRLYPPWVYGVSRVDIGRGQLGNSDGSVGAWAAKGAEEKGLLKWGDEGVPAYSGQIAKTWGRRPGPPQSLYPLAANHKATKAAPARSADDIMNGLANGYAATIASSRWGCKSWRQVDGRMVANHDDRWGHQQCVIGYDGSSPSGKRWFYVLNSWGENWGPKPLQNEPRGGYWMSDSQLDDVCDEGDSWILGGVDGFIEQELNWSIIRRDQPVERAIHSHASLAF